MALADIITKIKSEADAEAMAIRAHAENEARTLETQSAEELAKRQDEARQASTTAAEAVAARVVSSAQHKARLTREAKRTEVMHAVFNEAQKLLETLPREEYEKFIVAKAKPLHHLEGVITIAPEREEETKAALKTAGLSGAITVAPRGVLLGGFIFETKDALYDYSFKTLLARAREGSGTTLAQTLFA